MASTQASGSLGERTAPLTAALLLLPAALLAWPGPPANLEENLVPELSGAGLALLASVPAAIAVLLRRRRSSGTRGALPLLCFGACGALSLYLLPPSDTLGASRALATWTTGAVLFFGGASLTLHERTWLLRGLVLLSLAFVGFSFTQSHGLLTGTLGNTGAVSEAALPGAVVGAWIFARGRGAWRAAGLLAAFSYALYVGRAPVHAGAASLAIGLLAAWAGARGKPRDDEGSGSAAWLVLALLCGAAVFGERLLNDAPRGSSQGAGSSGSETGGIEVRAILWRTSLPVLRDAPWLGIGPGQFAATYPPYRNPREIELSSHGRRIENETEVPHAHNDWLQGFLDAGLLGGAFWALFLAATGLRAARSLRGEDRERAALSAVALAVLAGALVRSPLLANPAASTLAFALFGAVRGTREPKDRASRIRGTLPLLLAALLFAQTPRALAIVRHGDSLSSLFRTPPVENALENALLACPDSVEARSMLAKLRGVADSPPADPAEQILLWSSVLELRPHRLEAWMELGRWHARAGEHADARYAMDRALTLDPANPRLRRNRALLELRAGELDDALERILELRADGTLTDEVLLDWTISELQHWRVDSFRDLLASISERFEELTAESAYALAKTSGPLGTDDDERLAHALEAYAHLTWAREHAGSDQMATALRSYRQARMNVAALGQLPLGLRLEWAAAARLAGQDQESRRALNGAEVDIEALEHSPPWVRRALAP